MVTEAAVMECNRSSSRWSWAGLGRGLESRWCPSVLKMEEAECAPCPVSCSAGIDVLNIHQSKPLPQDQFRVGKGLCYALGGPGMLLGAVLAQPLRVCFPSKCAFWKASRWSELLSWHSSGFPAHPLGFLVYSQTLLCRGPFCLSHVRMELCDSPPSVVSPIREEG